MLEEHDVSLTDGITARWNGTYIIASARSQVPTVLLLRLLLLLLLLVLLRAGGGIHRRGRTATAHRHTIAVSCTHR
jgi:hypothetical protein